MLAQAAGPMFEDEGIETAADHPIAKLIAAGSHPDLRWLRRLENEKTGNLARNITVEQVRELGEFLSLTPALSPWRAVVIDSVDDLEKSAANALLKMLEEPPPNTAFLLVSHAPGKLLPTIRSRCRRLQFESLADEAMTSVLGEQLPDADSAERGRLVSVANGSVGRALAFASLELGPLESDALAILREGDPDNSRRSALASQLARKAAADRYFAFLDLLPSLVAQEARTLAEPRRERALDAYARVRELAAVAPRLSLDPAATVFQLGGILASVSEPSTQAGRT
jgi:DNA polymerase-3 subunit delta'